MSSPSVMAGRAWRRRMFRKAAIRAPVQAPVPAGDGHEQHQPQQTVFPHQTPLQVGTALQGIDLRSEEGVLPQPVKDLTHQQDDKGHWQQVAGDGSAAGQPRVQPAAIPAGMAPRSSTTGTAAMAMVIMYFPRTVSQKAMRSPLHKNCPGV